MHRPTRVRALPLTLLSAAAVSALLAALVAGPSAAAFADAGPAQYGSATLDFGQVTYGSSGLPLTETVTNSGTDPLTMGTVTITDDTDPASFAVGTDGCSLQVLAGGASCDVQIRARPQGVRTLTATLNLPDDSASGGGTVALHVFSVDTDKGNLHARQAKRFVDTRSGLNVPDAAIAGGHHVVVDVVHGTPLPSVAVSAVTVNILVTHETTSGYLTIYPSGSSRPSASTVKYAKGSTTTQAATLTLGSNGKIDIYNSSGHADVVVYLTGWYSSQKSAVGAPGGSYHPGYPERIVDTRVDGHALKSNYYSERGISYNGIDAGDIKALAVTITGTNVHASGELTVYSGDTIDPALATGVFVHAGRTSANLAIVPTESCPTGEDWCTDQNYSIFRIYNGTARALDYVVDIVGYYAADSVYGGGHYQPFETTHRIVDTRTSLGTGPFGPGGTHAVSSSLADDDTLAFAANLTVLDPSASTYVAAWPDFHRTGRPGTSLIHAAAHQTVAAGTLLTVGYGNVFEIYNNAGHTDLLMDVTGRFEFVPGFAPAHSPALRAAGSAATAPGQRLRQPPQVSAVGHN